MSTTDPLDPTGAAVRNFLLRRSTGNDDAPAPAGQACPADSDLHVAYAWDVAGELADDPAMLRLRSEALGWSAPEDAMPAPRHARGKWFAFAGLAAMAAATTLYLALPSLDRPAPADKGAAEIAMTAPADATTIVSAPGKRRMITLTDGTDVILDADSDLRVAFTDKERRIFLLNGRAYFDVHHESRPFMVNSGGGETIDLGTRFVVDTGNGQTLVSLVEGKVMVRPDSRSPRVPLKPGQTLRYAGGTPTAILAQIEGDPLDWTVGKLTFDETPLVDAVRILSRYSQTPLTVSAEAAAQDRRVTGVFFTRNQADFATALAGALDLRMTPSPDGGQRLSPR